MDKRREAMALIAAKKEQAEQLLKEAQALADEHLGGVDAKSVTGDEWDSSDCYPEQESNYDWDDSEAWDSSNC